MDNCMRFIQIIDKNVLLTFNFKSTGRRVAYPIGMSFFVALQRSPPGFHAVNSQKNKNNDRNFSSTCRKITSEKKSIRGSNGVVQKKYRQQNIY